MKLLVMGASSRAEEAALYFRKLGVEVSLFSETPCLGSGKEFQRPFSIHRIQKRFLKGRESFRGRSRLIDLFRAVYFQGPREEDLPEGLSDTLKSELLRPLENYEDFDLVIDAREERFFPEKILAINENILGVERIRYGKNCYQDLLGVKTLAIIGSSESINKFFLFHQRCIEIEVADFFIVTSDVQLQFCPEVEASMKLMEDQFQKDCDLFTLEMNKWKALESYIQVKVKKPPEPQRKVKIHTSSRVTSLEKLKESENIFLGIESIDFDKNEDFLRVVGVGQIFVDLGERYNNKIYKDLDICEIDGPCEDGIYFLGNRSLHDELLHIEKDIQRFFKKVEG